MPVPTRTCPTCGALVAQDAPCPGCSLAGALATLGFNAPPALVKFTPLDLPSQFGNYKVEREVAAGGMGMVYEAEDTRLGRRVALKMLRQVFFATELERLRFQTEAELASRLDHPHIVPIHEVGVQDGQPFFTMKFIRGGNLAERLAAGPLPPREAAALMVKIAGAVHHAHQRGVLHRDLKPANILLDEAGEPWLTDFGIAKCLDRNSGLTLTRSVIGTPEYMSPEQAAGRTGEVSTASDVWALGVMLHQMLTGRLPFAGDSVQEVYRKITEKEVGSLVRAGQEGHERPKGHASSDAGVLPVPAVLRVPADLSTLCLRCLEKDAALRPSSAGELAEELERWLRGEPIRARRITGMERLGKWARRHPLPAALLGALVLSILGGTAAVTWQWRRAVASEQRALASADAERRTSYSAVLAQSLAAREHHDFGQARRLLQSIAPERRGFDWRLLASLCRGDDRAAWPLDAEPQCLAHLPHGQLAVITADGRLHLRDLHGKELSPPRALPEIKQDARHYRGLCYSPNGQRLAYACNDVLHVLDAATLAVLFAETSSLPQCGWLDDDRLLYGFNGSVARPPWPEAGAWILNFRGVAPGAEIPRTGIPQMCAPLAVAPDRRSFVLQLVVAEPSSWHRYLCIYPSDGDFTKTPAPLYQMPGREYPGVLAFSASGKSLAFSAGPSLRQSARVVEVATGRVLFDHAFRFPIHGVAIDPQEQRLALAGGDSAVRLYDFTRAADDKANTYDDAVDAARCQPIDGRGAHAPPQDLITRSAQDGRAIFYLGHEKEVAALTFCPAGGLFTAGADRMLRQWPAGVPRPSVRLGHMATSYPEYHPAASADGRWVLYDEGNAGWLLDVAASRGKSANITTKTAFAQAPLAVLRDGRAVTQDRFTLEVVIWAMSGGQFTVQKRLQGNWHHGSHNGRTRRGVLSEDEQHLAGSLEGILFTVDLAQGVMRYGGHGERASRYANHDLSPDGAWIATTDYGPRVTIHRFAEPEKIVATLTGERGYDTAVAFSRDGRRLFTGNEDGHIRVWDTATWTELPALGWPAHRSVVTALAVSHDGTLLATSGDDTLKLFPAAPEPGELYRRERLSFRTDQPANWLQFARGENGLDRALLHASPGGTLEVWETGP